jgi:hypothetical protein
VYVRMVCVKPTCEFLWAFHKGMGVSLANRVL